MNSYASSPSGNDADSQELHTTPPAAAEKPVRCSRSPQLAHDPSCGTIPAASSSFRRKARAFSGRAAAGWARWPAASARWPAARTPPGAARRSRTGG